MQVGCYVNCVYLGVLVCTYVHTLCVHMFVHCAYIVCTLCVRVYLCVLVCTSLLLYLCVLVCTLCAHVCTLCVHCVYMCVLVCTSMCVHLCVYIYVCTSMCVLVCTSMCVHMFLHLCVYLYLCVHFEILQGMMKISMIKGFEILKQAKVSVNDQQALLMCTVWHKHKIVVMVNWKYFTAIFNGKVQRYSVTNKIFNGKVQRYSVTNKIFNGKVQRYSVTKKIFNGKVQRYSVTNKIFNGKVQRYSVTNKIFKYNSFCCDFFKISLKKAAIETCTNRYKHSQLNLTCSYSPGLQLCSGLALQFFLGGILNLHLISLSK